MSSYLSILLFLQYIVTYLEEVLIFPYIFCNILLVIILIFPDSIGSQYFEYLYKKSYKKQLRSVVLYMKTLYDLLRDKVGLIG